MTISLVFTGNADDAVAALAKLERKYDDVENRLKQLNGKSPKSDTDGWSSSLDGVLSKYLAIGSAIGIAGKATSKAFGEVAKLQDAIDAAGKKNPEPEVKLKIQGGFTTAQVEKMMPVIEAEVRKTPSATLAEATKLQTQLASSGFNPDDVKSGAALGATLRLKAATNSFGEDVGDPKEAAKVSSMMLKALGNESPSAKNMEELNAKLVSIFKESDAQFPDFKQLAPKLSGLKNFGLTVDESLGAFASVSDVLGGNKADTGLSQFVSRTATAAGHQERIEALASIRMKPEDVAMAPGGKKFFETVDLMKDKLSKVTPEERNVFVSKFYGEDAGPTANLLFDEAGNRRAKHLTELAKDPKAYDEGVKLFQGDRFADQARTKLTTDASNYRMDKARGSYTWDEHRENMTASYNKRYGEADGPLERFITGGQKALQETMEGVAWGFGLSPRDAGLNPEAFKRRVQEENVLTNGVDDPRSIPIIDTNDMTGAAVDRERDGSVIPRSGGAKETTALVQSIDKNTASNDRLADAMASGSPRAGRPINRSGNVE